jgi:hypothetical protein
LGGSDTSAGRSAPRNTAFAAAGAAEPDADADAEPDADAAEAALAEPEAAADDDDAAEPEAGAGCERADRAARPSAPAHKSPRVIGSERESVDIVRLLASPIRGS